MATPGYIWVEPNSSGNDRLAYVDENGNKHTCTIRGTTSIDNSIDRGYVWIAIRGADFATNKKATVCYTLEDGNGDMYKAHCERNDEGTHNTEDGYLWIEGDKIWITGSWSDGTQHFQSIKYTPF